MYYEEYNIHEKYAFIENIKKEILIFFWKIYIYTVKICCLCWKSSNKSKIKTIP